MAQKPGVGGDGCVPARRPVWLAAAAVRWPLRCGRGGDTYRTASERAAEPPNGVRG